MIFLFSTRHSKDHSKISFNLKQILTILVLLQTDPKNCQYLPATSILCNMQSDEHTWKTEITIIMYMIIYIMDVCRSLD